MSRARVVGLTALLVPALLAVSLFTAPGASAGGTVVPVPVTSAPRSGPPVLIGADPDGSYAVRETYIDAASGDTRTLLAVIGPDGTSRLTTSVPYPTATLAYGDGVLAAISSTQVAVFSVSGASYTVSDRTGSSSQYALTPLGLAGSAGVLLQDSSTHALLLDAPDGSQRTIGTPPEELTSLSADHLGGLAVGGSGQLYRVDLDAPAVVAIDGITHATAVYERGAQRAVGTATGTLVRLAADGTPESTVKLPSGAGVPNAVSVSAAATFVRGDSAIYVGAAGGPLHALGLRNVSAPFAADGDQAYIDGSDVYPSGILRVGSTTSPAPTATIDGPAPGGEVGQNPTLTFHTDQDDITHHGYVQILDGPLLSDNRLSTGMHTLVVTVDGETGQSAPVSVTVDVVAHPVAVVVGSNRQVYLRRDGHWAALGGVGVSAPSVASLGDTDYVAVGGTDGAIYLRTEQVGWTRVVTAGLCGDPALQRDDNIVPAALYLSCHDSSGALLVSSLSVSATRLGAALGTNGVITSAGAFSREGGVIHGAPVPIGGAPDDFYVLGNGGRVYEHTSGHFGLIPLSCAGPLGGGSTTYVPDGVTTVGCAQSDGSLTIFTDDLHGFRTVRLGGRISGAPGIAVQSDGTSVITAIGAGGALYQQSFDGTAGHGWTRIDGAGQLGLSGTWTDGP